MRKEWRSALLVGEGNFSYSAALCHSAEPGSLLVATCFQSEPEATGHEDTARNIARLLQAGAEVHFQVDCTRLQENPALKGRLFDRIIFNFPHCGRKAGVRRNRELLAKFFLSCADTLAADGSVTVALCSGQGGTAADLPMREWHNSWQVVALAAEGGLILTDVLPFDHTHCSGYTSTGYRNFLEKDSKHPVNVVKEQLLKELGRSLSVCELESECPLVARACPRSVAIDLEPEVGPDAVYFLRGAERLVRSERLDPGDSDRFPLPPGASEETESYRLRPSLTGHVAGVSRRPDFRPGTLYALSGEVFRKRPVAPLSLPAFHQLVLVGVPRDGGLCPSLLAGAIQCLTSLRGEVTVEPGAAGKRWDVCVRDELRPDVPELVVGSVTADRLGVAPSVTALNLDLLALWCYRIPDWRLLWTWDGRFLGGFVPPGPFSTFSLHPPCYTHDLSFWEPGPGPGPGRGWDELEFQALVRRASGEAVREVLLLERFLHAESGRASRCYRLLYQSCDRALSRQRALEIQLHLRQELQTTFRVVLR
ncbi:ferredoxin-fold anticodon-binding domain-containing protein 1 isoform X2 [Callorhinchus milii]|uniref:ferredoxin-fold anticodon-binding domain-containing protein 1 isoform X2 n=1 Tax=Callorhinchus milii TaxID=7868 RepID=UPI0004574E39|nr:ferredoxin-fold anticodon-binding domain-containing protein 1 isoform X2 [Callorhinchus milii]|eukprot:gi/632988418/ref/XP_007883099.1/ PREDICTED: ferredoxin-fold anticodon-binding domain-containing protein 1 isoform X2 [Callorhinchus milii]